MKILKFASPAGMTAAATDSEEKKQPREISGLVIPFGEAGHTSAGTLTARKGSITLPTDVTHCKLYRDHSNIDGSSPVGYAVKLEETDTGIMGTFHIAATADGDTALADVKEKVRDALSVELINHHVEGSEIVAAQLMAVALVATPAYASSRVTTVTANNDAEPVTPKQEVKTPMNVKVNEPKKTITAAQIYESIAAISRGAAPDELITGAVNALAVAKSASLTPPQWLGELWGGLEYKRKFVPAMKQATLSDLKLQGWRWKEKPTVATYAGHPAEVPSASPQGEVVEAAAKRLAGINSLDRAYYDFGKTDVVASFLKAMAESYAIQSDTAALKAAIAAPGKADDQSKNSFTLLKAAAWARLKIKRGTHADPSIYVVNDEDWFSLIDIKEKEIPVFLEKIGATIDQIVPDSQVTSGTVVAWNKQAMTFGELPGSPIRSNAIDLAHGGNQEAMFGYYATLNEHPSGVAVVKFSEPVPTKFS